MKSRQLITTLLPLAVLAAAAQSARAESPVYEYPQATASTVSRAEVSAQAIAARDAGLVIKGEASYEMPVRVASSGLTRAQVRAEAIEAQRLGLAAFGERTARDATPAELEQIRLAGLKALQAHLARR